MCGIVGVLCFEGMTPDRNPVATMTRAIKHRGPDGEGFLFDRGGVREWIDFKGRSQPFSTFGREEGERGPRLALGHCRLSVIDLSERGHQPMTNEDGSLWVVHNGEIYNYLEIRKELERKNHQFKSMTDTEVILHAYEEWGTDCLHHFNGMWAFGIWDSKEKRLFCSRDRAGVKPFYYIYDGKRLAFASEIKALLALEDLTVSPNEQIIADYLFFGVMDHTRETFFKDICQLRPGEFLMARDNDFSVHSYWDIEPREVRFPRKENYGERFYELLEDSIRLRLRSDVPVGSCLSGGLDSSSIVCLANRLMFNSPSIDRKLVGERQKTFSSCFQNDAYDERKYIEKVIERTGAEKNYIFPQPEDLFQEMARLMWHQEEPFGSTSIYAQWKVMKCAKDRGVIVLLDGQGGDELLAGYLSSFFIQFAKLLKRKNLGQFIQEIKGFKKTNAFSLPHFLNGMIAALLPPQGKQWIRRVLRKGVEWSESKFQKRYLRVLPKPDKFEDPLNNYLYEVFRLTSLPGLLHYEDRNSMAFSLEARVPFLDYRLVEYTFSLPSEQKIRDGVTKVILRDAMEGVLPEEIRNRTDKMGFVTPEDIWFRTILKNQIYQIINSKSFADRGYFDVRKVNEAFNEHCQKRKNISSIIWRWVNLELWFRTFMDKKPILEN